MNFKEIKPLIIQTFAEWSEDKASRLAAALAYYTIFSIPSLLIIVIAIAAQVFERSLVQQKVVYQIAGLVGQTGAQAIEAVLENVSEPGDSLLAAAISIITLLFGASGVFGQLHDALNTIWEVQAKPGRGLVGTFKDRFFSFTMVLGVGFLLLVSLVVSTVLQALNEFVSGVLPSFLLMAQILNFLVSFSVITVLFALIYKIVPDVRVAWHDVWIGSLVTAFLFTVGKWGIGLYLGNSAPGSTYGAAGSLIVLLLWIYYSAQILFLGAEFTQVYANNYGSRIVADETAVSLTPATRAQQGIPHTAMAIQQTHHSTAQSPAPTNTTLQSATAWMKRFHHYLIETLAVIVAGWLLLTKRN